MSDESFLDSAEEPARAFIRRVYGDTRPDGKGKREVRSDLLAEAIRDDPDSAAAVVSAICRQREVPSLFAQLAITIAVFYQNELGDDSLMIEVERAPWRPQIDDPELKPDDEGAAPPRRDPLDVLLNQRRDAIRGMGIDAEQLSAGSIDLFLEIFSAGGETIDRERALRQSALWGLCILLFPLDDDPRFICAIPSARRFVAKLHEAMPYFPCYLNFRPEAGMFVTYFGCLADEEAVNPDGPGVDIYHPSILNKIGESLDAVGRLALAIGKDPRPIWRTALSVYPPDFIEEVVANLDRDWS
jgi:hypothetical protein